MWSPGSARSRSRSRASCRRWRWTRSPMRWPLPAPSPVISCPRWSVRSVPVRSRLPSCPRPARCCPRIPASELVAASLRTGTRRLLLADIGVRRREEDAVHQMRVACRRMRSDLKTFRPLVEPLWGEALTHRAQLARRLPRRCARSRGAARAAPQDGRSADPPYDLEAFERLDAILAAREEAALTRERRGPASERYLRLLYVLVDAAREPVVSEVRAADRARRCCRRWCAAPGTSWPSEAKKLDPTASTTSWHEARIKAKQARYAAEAVDSVLGKPAARMAAGAKQVQEVLGDHQDAAIAAEMLVALAAEHLGDGALCIVAGRLIQANRCAVTDSRREFPPPGTRPAKPWDKPVARQSQTPPQNPLQRARRRQRACRRRRSCGAATRARSRDREMAVVHRPKYDDWSMPKGKVDAGEQFVVTARREVVRRDRAHGGVRTGHRRAALPGRGRHEVRPLLGYGLPRRRFRPSG